jgi:hypothetical protein
MRKIISQGLNTVMEDVFSRPEEPQAGAGKRDPLLRPAIESPKSRPPGKNTDRGARHAWQIGKPLAVLFVVLTSANVFAETHGVTVGEALRAGEQNRGAQTQAVKRIDLRKQSATRQPGLAKHTAERVYLDDYQLLPQAATRKYPTEAHYIGQKGKTRE